MPSSKYALAGGAYTGKSALARYMHESAGFTLIDYSHHLKRLAVDSLEAVGVHTTARQIEFAKEAYRDYLIALAKVSGFDQGAWVKEIVWSYGNPDRAVFDNVRFQGQWDILKDMGYTLVRLVTTQDVLLRRSGLSEERLRRIQASYSEHSLPPQEGEIVLDSSAPLDELVQQLLERGVERGG